MSGDSAVVIPSTITAIADFAFTANKTLRSVVIPPSVRSIGESAFVERYSPTSVTIPDSTSIGDNAFDEGVQIIYMD